jgi:hypothetical protein
MKHAMSIDMTAFIVEIEDTSGTVVKRPRLKPELQRSAVRLPRQPWVVLFSSHRHPPAAILPSLIRLSELFPAR